MQNILDWYIDGETGISSKAMAAIACGKAPKDQYWNHPRDPADLNRCIKLVDKAPEVKEAFGEIAKLSNCWSAIIENWDDLRECFINEVGYDWCNAKRAPRTYKKMEALLDAARKAA